MRQGAKPIMLNLKDPLCNVEWAQAAGEADGRRFQGSIGYPKRVRSVKK
jgi:hypothetical protein